jgi:hypothetical protein
LETADGNYLFSLNYWDNINERSDLFKISINGNLLWNNTYPGFLFDCVCNSVEGGFVLSGLASYGQALLVNVDSNGNIKWAKSYSESSFSYLSTINTIRETPDGGYIGSGSRRLINHSDTDALIVKVDNNGSINTNCLNINQLAITSQTKTDQSILTFVTPQTPQFNSLDTSVVPVSTSISPDICY